ncbi:GGDEF domain-containing protein [Marinitoga sp. 38H-ov]|uniref:GGDEF domain-containing protein n=1 Tax=Marinitoga sp. 38H-ov TaxID=1755814 RepID=UPI0013EDABD0|nr:GGDEF domain-containing protein [Marinitoga sp. 38H-ov]KAF2955753.1 hypothetical protein AS160_08915 [Marinitoga sp. 38H-ov]
MENFEMFIRNTAFGKEYIETINNSTFRVRITESTVFNYNNYKNIIYKLEALKEIGLIIPEMVKYKNGKYYIYSEYWDDVPILDSSLNDEKYYNILFFIFDISDRIVHSSNFNFKYISLEDIFIDKNGNISMLAPIFIPKNDNNIVINNGNNELGLIEALKELSEKLYSLLPNKSKNIEEFLLLLKSKKILCVHDLYEIILKKIKNKNINKHFRYPHFINRDIERNIILNNLGKKHLFIYGPQRSGKTKLIDFMKYKMKELGYFIIYSDHLISEFDKNNINIFDFLNYIDKLKSENENLKLLLIVDDFQDIDIHFKNFIEDLLLKDFDFPFSIILLSHTQPDIRYNNIEYVELKKFNLKDVKILLNVILSSSFLKEYPEIVDIVYNLSDGLPGNIIQLIKDFFDLNIIEFNKEKFFFYPEKIKNKKFKDFVFEKIKTIPENIKNDLKYLSALGYKFSISEIKILEDLLKIDFDYSILYALDNNIILKERENYRFFNLLYQKILHDLLTIDELNKIHNYLCKFSSLNKKIYHLKSTNNYKSAIALIINEMKRSLFEWKNLNFIDYGFNEIKNMTENVPYSAIAIYLSKKYFLNEYSDELKIYLEKLKTHKVYNYIYYLFLKFSDKNKLNKILIEQINDKKTTDYKKALYIYYYLSINFTELTKEKILEFYSLFEKIFLKYSNLKKFKTLNGMLLNILGIKFENDHPEKSIVYYNNSLKISLETNYKRLTQIVYANLAILYKALNSNLSDYYNNKVLDIAKDIGDYYTYNRTLINIAENKLYNGNINEFFNVINLAEKSSKLNNDYNSFLLANDIKNYYFLYSKDYQNLLSNLKRIESYIKNKKYIKEPFNHIKDNILVLKSLFENKKKFNNKYMKIIESDDFLKHLYNLVVYDDEKILYESFLFFKNNPLIYLKEEMINIISSKIAKYSFNKEFETWIYNLINEFKDKKLSLALLYEGLGLFYYEKKESFKSLKFLRKAQKIYDDLLMKNKFNEIGDFLSINFGLPSLKNDNIISNENLISRLIFYEKINDLIIELLKIDSPKHIVEKIGEFLRQSFPLDKILIKVITNNFEVEYNFNYLNENYVEKDLFILNPFIISYISNNNDYKYSIYISNDNIELDILEISNILDNIIVLEDVLYSVLDKITHYEHSISDPLTNAYTRRYMENKLNELYGLYERYNFDFSIILIDLDDFKKINDKYGHQKGDLVLVELVKSLKENLRDFDLICRYGGEEFLIILPNTKIDEAKVIASRLLNKINKDLYISTDLNITCSMGLSSISKIKNEPKIDNLIKEADIALYKAKKSGKNRFEFI